MNQRLEGWKLALAVLIPAAIIAGAIWFALQALSGDDDQALDASQTDTSVATATPAPETDQVTEPTIVPTPTALVLPTALPLPTVTTGPSVEATSTAPVPTSTPSGPSPTRPPAGPTATPTPDPSALVITCGGATTFPVSIGAGDSIPGVAAAVSPPDAAPGLNFSWNFGNGQTAQSSNTGAVTFDKAGTYTVTLTATDKVSGVATSTTCGIVTVGKGENAALTVSCQVRPASSSIKWADATVNDNMRITTSWTPKDTILNLQYEFPSPSEPLVFSTAATSGDNLTYLFTATTDLARVFWRDPDTRQTGRISCPAFTDAPAPIVTVTPTSYAGAVGP